MVYVDSHAHLCSDSILPNIEEVLERARQAQITHILNICTDPQTLKEGILLADRFSFIKNAGAMHPHDVEQEGERSFPIFNAAIRDRKLVAVGETGLDYHYEHSSKVSQQKFLKKYLHLAAESNLPVIFHCREAFDDLFTITEAEYPRQGIAVLHCFTGTLKEAEQVLERGWYISFSGIITFKKSESLREIVKQVPLDRLLIETDAPFLSPQSHRGKTNEPSFLPETAQCIANIKNIDLKEVAIATSENAKRVFFL